MLLFNIPIPNIFHLGESARQGFNSHYERKIGADSRNSALLMPLEQSLFTLEDIRARIGTRNEKETASGTDMTAALSLLGTSDILLSYAEQDVAVATSTVNSAHPGYMEIENAYETLNQYRDALSGVLHAIEDAVAQASSTPQTP